MFLLENTMKDGTVKIELEDGGSASVAPAHAQSAPAQNAAPAPASTDNSSSTQEDDLPF